MPEETEVSANPARSLVNVARLVHALHALGLLIGITTAATIIGAFVLMCLRSPAVVINS